MTQGDSVFCFLPLIFGISSFSLHPLSPAQPSKYTPGDRLSPPLQPNPLSAIWTTASPSWLLSLGQPWSLPTQAQQGSPSDAIRSNIRKCLYLPKGSSLSQNRIRCVTMAFKIRTQCLFPVSAARDSCCSLHAADTLRPRDLCIFSSCSTAVSPIAAWLTPALFRSWLHTICS